MAAVGKRKLDEVVETSVVLASTLKKAREDGPTANRAGALVASTRAGGALLPAGIKRTSGLLSPTMLLSGHEGEIFTCKFSPSGSTLASGSFDRSIFLWNTYGECENYNVLKGHAGAILELQWTTDGSRIVSASTDQTVGVWDAETGERLKRCRGHTGIVNSCCPARRGEAMVSGSDDGTVKVWDLRRKGATATLNSKYQVTAVCFSADGQKVYSGGIDNVIKCWDLRNNEVEMSMPGHQDTVTGLSLSPDGSFLLSNAMDNTVRAWDIRPYKAGDRQIKLFMGAQHNFEKNLLRCSWSADGKMVTSGSADRNVYIWDMASTRLMYKLPGHAGSVNETVFHPTEPIVASCSSDRKIYLGELAQ